MNGNKLVIKDDYLDRVTITEEELIRRRFG